MSAYVIVFVEEPADHTEIDRYRKLAIPTFQGRKAKFHVDPRCAITTIEGDPVDVVVMIEFDSMEEAKAWYYSPEYQNAVKHRLGTARSRSVIVEKLPESAGKFK
ncbi:MAG: DUF1330 domain-containing protein [Steroidobacteraceae bacterium]